MNSLTYPRYFIGNQTRSKNPVQCGLGGKFGSNCGQYCEKSKKTAISLGFFLYFTRGKAKSGSVIVKQWKFMANIARNAKF